MDLQEFIRAEVDKLVDEWEAFAGTCVPAAKALDAPALRDNAKSMLLSFADYMGQDQRAADCSEKTMSDLEQNSPALTEAGRSHADQRYTQGFTVTQMVAEFRALRATVIRRWTAKAGAIDATVLDEVARFGEAVDQAVNSSVTVHANLLESSRTLLLNALWHDLRSPLGAIRLSAEYLLRTENLGGSETKAASRIVSSSTVMRKMVDDLLDFTQTMLSRALPLKAQESNLGDICTQIVGELVAVHPGCSINVVQQGDLSGHWDPARLAQLLTNLAANAIQHGTLLRPVTITLTGKPDTVNGSVHNEGPPIPENARAPLFKPVVPTSAQRTSTASGSTGLGLGLYIANEIVIAHKGKLELMSNKENGTTFTFRLPRTVHGAEPEVPAA